MTSAAARELAGRVCFTEIQRFLSLFAQGLAARFLHVKVIETSAAGSGVKRIIDGESIHLPAADRGLCGARTQSRRLPDRGAPSDRLSCRRYTGFRSCRLFADLTQGPRCCVEYSLPSRTCASMRRSGAAIRGRAAISIGCWPMPSRRARTPAPCNRCRHSLKRCCSIRSGRRPPLCRMAVAAIYWGD